MHFTPGDAESGRVTSSRTTVTYGAPHHLVADGPLLSHRRTRAGDNWADGVRPKTSGVSLGLPSFGAPATVSARKDVRSSG